MTKIKFADFRGKPIKPRSLFSAGKYETLDQILEDANRWVETHGVEVFNVETVLLPISAKKKDDNASRWANAHWGWQQMVRVWYRE